MTVSFFQVPDSLIANIPQAAAQGQNTQMSNLILEHPTPKVPEANATLNKAQIKLLMAAIDTHYANAVKTANIWQNGDATKDQRAVNDWVIDVMNEFVRFQYQFSNEYKEIIEAAYNKNETRLKDKLMRLQRLLEEVVNTIDGAGAAVKNYETDLSAAQAEFTKDYTSIMKEVDADSKVITAIKAAVATLQENISENNSQVLDTAVDTAGTAVEQGVTMFASAAAEDVGGAVSAGVQIGIAGVKGIVKTIQLNGKTLEDLNQVRELSMKISEDEVILTALVNIGTMLISLGGTRGIGLDIVTDIQQYWENMASGIGNLLETAPGNLSAKIDTVNFSPETEKYKNPAFPPWNVILPLQKAAAVFDLVLALTPQTFGNDTQFEKLPKSG